MVFFYVISFIYTIIELCVGFTFYGFFLFFSLLFYVVVLLKNALQENTVFFLRNAMLVSPAFIAGLVKLIDADAIFSFHMTITQTLSITCLMVALTNFALISSAIGFKYSSRNLRSKLQWVEGDQSNLVFILTALILWAFSAIILHNSAGNVLSVAYATKVKNTIDFGVASVICNIMFLYLLYYTWKYKKEKNLLVRWVVFCCGVYLIGFVYLLHGIRMNALNLILSIVIFRMIFYTNQFRVSFKVLSLLFFLYVIMQLVGVYRYANFDLSHFTFWNNLLRSSITQTGQRILINQGTVNDIAATFSGIIYLIKTGMVDYQYGLSYLEWLPRTLPHFLYPNRPEAPAWIFQSMEYSSGGGFFELASVYYNFGVVGAIFVPGIFSYIIGRLFHSLLNDKNSTLRFFLFFSVMVSFMRGGWYQSFSWYKSFIVVGLLYVFIMFILGIRKRYYFKEQIDQIKLIK